MKKANKVFKKIKRAKKPIILIGENLESKNNYINQMLDPLNIPVLCNIQAKGAVDESKKFFLDICSPLGNYSAQFAIKNADLVIIIGSDLLNKDTKELLKFKKDILQINSEKQNEKN